MVLMKKFSDLSIVTVSVFGGVFHNIGQLLIGLIVVSSYSVLAYLPVLLIAGIICGIVIGILAKIMLDRTSKLVKKLGV